MANPFGKSITAKVVRFPVQSYEDALIKECAACYADPLRFVRVMYPWPIQGCAGPDEWQCDALDEIGAAGRDRGYNGADSVAPIRKAISSGNGVGKTANFAWLVDWLMSTRPDTRGTVTANTSDQLEKKTWAAVREWT